MWTDRQIAAASDERSIQRGIAYADSGAVRLLSADERVVNAVVVGSDSYRVKLTPTTWDCTCPVGLEDWFCKHCVATASADG